jgi:glycosyltransferase involved in cell wall biosynthesis
MDSPLVSCVLPTCNRRGFFKQALTYYQRQDYPNKELIIVDDGEEPVKDLLPADTRIQYFFLDRHTNLGAKLNFGIDQARGRIIQKLDDDDYYHPHFLRATVQALTENGSAHAITALECFLVLIASSGALKHSGMGWFSGPTLCFFKDLWEKTPFRDLPRAVDYFFLNDTQAQRVRIAQAELLMLVRHSAGHTWNMLGKQDVTDYFRKRLDYTKSLADYLLFPEDLAFYCSLRPPSPENAS